MSATAIVIPTMNRPEYLIRQLAYYADLGFDHSIYVGDSSSSEVSDQIQKSIGKLTKQIKIDYIHIPQANPYQAIGELLTKVREPYATFVSDDDFLVPGSLDKCAQFLDSNPEYQSAHGIATSFTLGATREYGEITDSLGYFQRPVEQPSPRLRLMDLSQAYWPVRHSMQRVEPFKRAIDLTSGQFHDAFRKLLFECLSVIQGKAKELDCLYLIKQRHFHYTGLPGNDTFDWITSSEWSDSYRSFSDSLATELAHQEQITLEEAREVVKQSFWTYLANQMSDRRVDRPNSNSKAGPSSRVMRFGKLVPGARWAYREYEKWKVVKLDSLSLRVLMNHSSPYHKDFMAVYRAVITPSPESIVDVA